MHVGHPGGFVLHQSQAGCCGEVGFFNTKRKPDFQMIKHGHPDELVVIM